MAMSVKKGSFQAPTATGNVGTTGVGFTPTALILFATKQNAAGYAAGGCIAIGFCVSATKRKTNAIASDDNVGTPNAGRRSADLAISITDGTPTVLAEADFVSMDGDGFTLNWTTAGASKDYIIHYLALGGASLTNADVGDWTPAASTGNLAKTGVGFQPDIVFLMGANQTGANPVAVAGYNISLSAFVSGTKRGAVAVAGRDATANTLDHSYQRALAHSSIQTTTDNALQSEADFVSMDSDGWTLNFSSRVAADHYAYLALKGGSYWAGVDTQKTSTGTQAKTGFGFLPAGLLFFGTNRANSASIDDTLSKLSVGATDGVNQGATWFEDVDNLATTDSNMRNVTSVTLTHSASAATTTAEAAISSMDADGYTLNWTTADGTAREFIAVGFGPAAVGGAGPEPLGLPILGA